MATEREKPVKTRTKCEDGAVVWLKHKGESRALTLVGGHKNERASKKLKSTK